MSLFGTRHHHHHKTELVPYVKKVDIHEHRAPTDESIKLYKEVKEKAINDILFSMTYVGSHISFSAVGFYEDPSYDKITAFARININGNDLKLKFDINKTDFDTWGTNDNRNERIKEVLIREYSNHIAQIILSENKGKFEHLYNPFKHF